jgi:p-aminobenzoyl-glutamate transporter AbgT
MFWYFLLVFVLSVIIVFLWLVNRSISSRLEFLQDENFMQVLNQELNHSKKENEERILQ